MSNSNSAKSKGPKTELDEKFLSITRQVMKSHGITSDRAISIALGRKPDFINRVSNGTQSATPEAWDVLFAKHPEARNITNNTITQSGNNSIGNVEGDSHQYNQRERDGYKEQVEQLRSQLVDKDKLIATLEGTVAAKEEIISLLRGGYNRPN